MRTWTYWPWPGGSSPAGAGRGSPPPQARRGGEFTALFLPRRRPVACDGEVVVRIAPREDTGPATVVAAVQVRAVAADSLVRVVGCDLDSLDLWPEIVRGPLAFALGRCANSRTTVPTSVLGTRVDLVAAAGRWPRRSWACPAGGPAAVAPGSGHEGPVSSALPPRSACVYQAVFSLGTPDAVIIAAVKAALTRARPQAADTGIRRAGHGPSGARKKESGERR